MNFTLELVTGPDIEPISLAQMKRHLRMYADITTEDDDVLGLITGAREWVEDFTGRALIDETWRLSIGCSGLFAGTDRNTVTPIYTGSFIPRVDGGILLRRSPVLEIMSFASVDAAGAETEIDADAYELRDRDSKWPRVYGLNGSNWNGPTRITFRAGFADRLGSPTQGVEVVPKLLIQAMKLWATAMYAGNDPLQAPAIIKVAELVARPERTNLQIA